VEGLPWSIINQKYTNSDGAYESRVMLALKLLNPPSPDYFGDIPQTRRYTTAPFYKLNNYQWHHLIFTKYDDYLRVYVNGELMRKTYVPGLTYDNTIIPDLTINAPSYRFDNWIGGPFLGDVQRLSVFDRTLTDSDVEALYESSLLTCSDFDNDGYGTFPRSGVVNGCRLNGFDCNDANAGVGSGGC
jgi:hypothetical protein